MFGASGHAAAATSLAFVSAISLEERTVSGYGLRKRAVAVRDCRTVGKRDMKLNDATPVIKVDPETYIVSADGEELRCAPAKTLPLAQRYFLF
jgi:urease subunit alpha